MSPSRATLTQTVIELEQHVAAAGWDQPPRLFALVDTAALLAAEPALATALSAGGAPPDLTSVEQEDLPSDVPLDELLAQIGWPAEVAGAAIVVERLMLPPKAEEDLPGLGDGDVSEWVAQHPDRQEVRIAVGVTRDGVTDAALRLRSKDSDDKVLSGESLVPNLAAALIATFNE